jgi:hypothetical protein
MSNFFPPQVLIFEIFVGKVLGLGWLFRRINEEDIYCFIVNILEFMFKGMDYGVFPLELRPTNGIRNCDFPLQLGKRLALMNAPGWLRSEYLVSGDDILPFTQLSSIMPSGVDALPAVEDLPPPPVLPPVAKCRAFEDSVVVTDSSVIDAYITRRLNELQTTAEDLPALQRVVLELIHKARLTGAVFKTLRRKFRNL